MKLLEVAAGSLSFMEQLALAVRLPDPPRTLVDDATGRIVYLPAAVAADVAAAWFEDLTQSIDWRHERVPMYDRIVDVPRLTASFTFDEPLPATIAAARDAVEACARTTFNSVGLNLYRDGADSVAMHSDHTEALVPRSAIALLSLGCARRMRIAAKGRPRKTFDVALEAGSVLLMAGDSQMHWEHGVPKTRNLPGPRISLAFRRKLPS